MEEAENGQSYTEPAPDLDQLAHDVIGAAIEVHRKLGGPGLDESIYEAALAIELKLRGIEFQEQMLVDIEYKGIRIGQRRLDFLIAGRLVVELKAVDQVLALHKAQVLTYLRITNLKLGLLINFNEVLLHDCVRRIIRPD